jgi:hypothetical protein
LKTILTRLNENRLLLKPIDFTSDGIIIVRNSYFDVPRWLTITLSIVAPIASIIWVVLKLSGIF